MQLLPVVLVASILVIGTHSSIGFDEHMRDLMDDINKDITAHKVMVYSKTYCPFSKRLKAILAEYDIEDIKIMELNKQKEMKLLQLCLEKLSNRTTVPQLFIDGSFVGGHAETKALEDSGRLRKLLEDAHAICS